MNSPTSGQKTVLLVEDVAVNRRVAAAFLAKQGFCVVEAVTGAGALEQIAAAVFDLVLLDIRLPDMDGVDVAAHIRAQADPQKAQTPILALTANVFPDDIERYRSAGMNGVVAKPIQHDQFRLAVASVLQSTPIVASVAVETSGGSASPLDEAFIEERRRTLGQGTFDTILQLGRRSVAAAVEEVNAARSLTGDNMMPLAKAAHKLAGAASNFGFQGLFVLGQRIENLADPRGNGPSQPEAARAEAAAVPELYQQTLKDLEAWLARSL